MITPKFKVTQDADFIDIEIYAPLTMVSETEIFIEEYDFKFYSKPYFLRLTLPGKLNTCGDETARYDADTQSYMIHIRKSVSGEVFADLDMLTKLLMPSNLDTFNNAKPAGIEDLSVGDHSDDEDIDWRIEQTPFTTCDSDGDSGSLQKAKYGFGNQYSGMLSRIQAEISDIVDLPDADFTPQSERGKLRRSAELSKFDREHYLADYVDEDDLVQQIQKFRPWWNEEDIEGNFQQSQKDILSRLKPKHHLLSKHERHSVYLSLVDILLAYAYESRISFGEQSVESGWTIRKLCSTLSWLQIHKDMASVVRTSFTRCMCYPWIRNWRIARLAQRDVVSILASGRTHVLTCLLEIYEMMKDDEKHYILNDLYLKDYIAWCQYVNVKKFKKISEKLKTITIKKEDLDLELDVLESIAAYAMAEQSSDDSSSGESSSDDSSSESYDSCEQGGDSDADKPEADTDDLDKEVVNLLGELDIGRDPASKPGRKVGALITIINPSNDTSLTAGGDGGVPSKVDRVPSKVDRVPSKVDRGDNSSSDSDSYSSAESSTGADISNTSGSSGDIDDESDTESYSEGSGGSSEGGSSSSGGGVSERDVRVKAEENRILVREVSEQGVRVSVEENRTLVREIDDSSKGNRLTRVETVRVSTVKLCGRDHRYDAAIRLADDDEAIRLAVIERDAAIRARELEEDIQDIVRDTNSLNF